MSFLPPTNNMPKPLNHSFYALTLQQQQQQQKTQAQPIRLAHPTSYHLEQTRRREQASSNDGAPPTPNNSFTNSTIDPGLISNNMSSFQRPFFSHIKQESNSPDINGNDLEFCEPSSSMMSPLSVSPVNSPPINAFDAEELIGMRISKTGSHMGGVHFDTGSQLGESPGTQPSIYSPGPDSTEFLDFPSSAPTTVSGMDAKPINAPKYYARTNGFASHNLPISMSLPVTFPNDWYSPNVDNSSPFPTGGHPSSLHFPVEMLTEYIGDEESTEKRNMMTEKKRRRRESHNAVERRRRDNINEKIQELSTLLPDMYSDPVNKPNKGIILRRSVDYIRSLQQLLNQQNSRNIELEAKVRDLQTKLDGNASTLDNNSSPNMMS